MLKEEEYGNKYELICQKVFGWYLTVTAGITFLMVGIFIIHNGMSDGSPSPSTKVNAMGLWELYIAINMQTK